ncbi:MAG TPA: LysM peptidoglycan-binding domain-containing protein [Frankiaceae bacterium]|nr:LysM peptidoglycan-binding domain-containing protein [Frankiaceae bacterium]
MTAMTYDTPLRPRSTRPSPRTPDAASTPPTALRLTRRGRLVVLLVLATLLLVAFSLGRTSADAGSTRPAGPAPTTVVQPGETLWAIARRVAPAADPRVTVARLSTLNDLGDRPITAGQRLVLPR